MNSKATCNKINLNNIILNEKGRIHKACHFLKEKFKSNTQTKQQDSVSTYEMITAIRVALSP